MGALDEVDGVYFTGGDAGALRPARRARRLVATPRAEATLEDAGVQLDALVHSAKDPDEATRATSSTRRRAIVVTTAGNKGGRWDGEDATAAPGVRRPAGAQARRLRRGRLVRRRAHLRARGRHADRRAVELASRCGAHKLTGRAAYENQLEDPLSDA